MFLLSFTKDPKRLSFVKIKNKIVQIFISDTIFYIWFHWVSWSLKDLFHMFCFLISSNLWKMHLILWLTCSLLDIYSYRLIESFIPTKSPMTVAYSKMNYFQFNSVDTVIKHYTIGWTKHSSNVVIVILHWYRW